MCDIVSEATKTLLGYNTYFSLFQNRFKKIFFSSLLIFLLWYLFCCLVHLWIFHFKHCVFSSRICTFAASISLTRFPCAHS